MKQSPTQAHLSVVETTESKASLLDHAISIGKFLSGKKANNVIIKDVQKMSPFFDYLIIASAESHIQLNALEGLLDRELKDKGLRRINKRTDIEETPWHLIDIGFAVVHLFLDETRRFYNLEKIWNDGEVIFND